MRIIVISDTHQYYRNFETIVLRNPDADMFLHLGDGESEYQLLCRNMPEVADKFRYVKGNCDYSSDAPMTELIDLLRVQILAFHNLAPFGVRSAYGKNPYAGQAYKTFQKNVVISPKLCYNKG